MLLVPCLIGSKQIAGMQPISKWRICLGLATCTCDLRLHYSVYHYSMANYVAVLKKGMDMTPGGKSEEAVPPAERLGEEVDVERRVQLLVETTCVVLFNYVAQVCG